MANRHRERDVKVKGKRTKARDLFEGRPLAVGDHVLLGGTVCSWPGHWYLGTILWVGDEEILVLRCTMSGERYRELDSIYAVRAVGTITELNQIQELARKAVRDLVNEADSASSELGRRRDAVQAKLQELEKGGLKISSFDQAANDERWAEHRAIGETLDEEHSEQV